MSNPTGTFHNAETGETIERELTDEEIASMSDLIQLPDAE